VADLLSLDVEVILNDTTSLHFQIDEEDRGKATEHVRGGGAQDRPDLGRDQPSESTGY
jgi:hypothetical protein